MSPGQEFIQKPSQAKRRKLFNRQLRNSGRVDVGVPKIRHYPDPDACPPNLRCLAEAIGEAVTRHANASPGASVKPPEWICPPARAIDFDVGIQPTLDYTVLPAGSTLALCSMRTKGYHAATILGFGFTVAWDGATIGNPYLSCPVTLRINGIEHETFRAMTRQLVTGLTVLRPTSIFIPSVMSCANGALIELVFTNTHATDSVRIDGRFAGYQWMPAEAVAEGVDGGRVGA